MKPVPSSLLFSSVEPGLLSLVAPAGAAGVWLAQKHSMAVKAMITNIEIGLWRELMFFMHSSLQGTVV